MVRFMKIPDLSTVKSTESAIWLMRLIFKSINLKINLDYYAKIVKCLYLSLRSTKNKFAKLAASTYSKLIKTK
jgi:hypothetical protein